MLGYAVVNIRENLHHQIVALQWGKGIQVLYSGIQVDEIIFGNQPPQLLSLCQMGIAPFDGRPRKYDNLGVFECLKLVLRFFLRKKSIVISNKLLLYRKMGGVFAAFQVDDFNAQDALLNKINLVDKFIIFTQYFFFLERLLVALCKECLHLLGRDRDHLGKGIFEMIHWVG